MQVTQISADGLRRAYRISVPAADIEDKVVARLTDLGREARIPGFRAGKAPLAILRQRFGEAVKGEVLQSAIVDATQSAIDGEGIRPAMQPDIEDLEFEDGKDLEYTLALELMPEIEPPDSRPSRWSAWWSRSTTRASRRRSAASPSSTGISARRRRARRRATATSW